MKITIKEIARLAGVSRGTVDRALNNRGNIDPKKRQKILELAKQHGYVKNVFASNLAQNTSIDVAIVLPDPKTDPFWQSPRIGIEKANTFVRSYGLNLKYYDFNLFDSNSFCEQLDRAIGDKPRAILIAPVYSSEFRKYLQIAQQNGIPFICINSEISDPDILCYIGQNSYQCGQLAGRLFDLTIGHPSKIAVITMGHSSKNAIHIDEKIKGLKDYNNKMSYENEILTFQIDDFDQSKQLQDFGQTIMEDHPDLRGMFITNSRAYHMINKVPLITKKSQEITVIGFDLLYQNTSLLENGSIDFLLNQRPARQGYLGLINILNYFVFKKRIEPKQYLPIDIVVKENYKNYLPGTNIELELVS